MIVIKIAHQIGKTTVYYATKKTLHTEEGRVDHRARVAQVARVAAGVDVPGARDVLTAVHRTAHLLRMCTVPFVIPSAAMDTQHLNAAYATSTVSRRALKEV